MGRHMSMTLTDRARMEPIHDRSMRTAHPELFNPRMRDNKRSIGSFSFPGVINRPNTSMGFGTYGCSNSPKRNHPGYQISPPKPFLRESVYWRR